MRKTIGYYTEEYPDNHIPWENFSPFDEAYFDESVIPMVGDVIMSKTNEYYEVVRRIFKAEENAFPNGEPNLHLHLILRKIELKKLKKLEDL